MAEEGAAGQVQRWLGVLTTVIAPATLLSALLFYFGYVSSRAQYAYFGIDVDTIGLGTRDYVMRSPQPLLAPLLALALAGSGAVLVHVRLSRWIAAADDRQRGGYRRANRAATIAAAVLLVAALGLLLGYAPLQDWAPYPLVTPLLLAGGAGGLLYTRRLRRRLLAPAAGAETEATGSDLARGAAVLAGLLVVVSVFWATATVAQWTGRGLARHYAARLDEFPSVILDTQERLYLRDPGVQETALPATAGQRFRYRYRHLRLLIEGHDRLFLVPDRWSPSDSTLLVPLDSTVRLQFQFRNEAP
ncbi:MAG TPA: hypothetical protein VMB79_11755 [Jatrophihabitans sp.]|nr:hypothetical protein [Jatrophihabitans sp.]